MLRVLGKASCSGVEATGDRWVPLAVYWGVNLRDGPLYLFVTGREGGYIELKVDPNSGALYGLVIINLPPRSERAVEATGIEPESGVPVFDLELWDWKVTPDYREPAGRDAEMDSRLWYSTPSGHFALWFSSSAVRQYLTAGDVSVGVSSNEDLVCIVVPERATSNSILE
ncbi:hypothetical protein GCM10028833_41200 [Glycomyces tarimensis]